MSIFLRQLIRDKVLFLGAVLIIIGMAFIGFWIRIQSIPTIPIGQFFGNDAYFYYWQACLISEQGHLPERDMHRWLPLGRDLGQTLNLYGYALAYAHKAIMWYFPNISLYHVALYAPAVCFCVGIVVFCFFLIRPFGYFFSSTVSVLLATLPGAIDRSTAGFSDRDAWCFMLSVLVMTTYLVSLQAKPPRKRLLWTLISGFFMFLGGLSWEGFGVFLSILLCVELWRFLSSETEADLKYYLIWVCTFVPTLYVVSPAYRSGEGFATHLSAFMLMPPLVLLGLRCVRHLLVTKTPFAGKFRAYSRTVALVLTLASITLAVGYVLSQLGTFASTTVPLSKNTLMQTVKELNAPTFKFWTFRYGGVLVCSCIGLQMVRLHLGKAHRILFVVILTFFYLTIFIRHPLDQLLGAPFGNILFGIAGAGCAFTVLLTAWQQQEFGKNEVAYIVFTIWFLLWVALARDAKRYDFFLCIPFAFFTAELLQILAVDISKGVKRQNWQPALKIGIAILIFVPLLFWIPVGGHATRAIYAAKKLHKPQPGKNLHLTYALDWMKTKIPHDAVVATNWSHGSQLNVLAGVKTIVDQDHYIPYWIDLYNRYVYFATAERELLEFLKSHNVTHIMLTKKAPKESFLRGQLSDAFVPVYPPKKFKNAKVKIWEIHYPPDIKTNDKYLETGYPEKSFRELQPR